MPTPRARARSWIFLVSSTQICQSVFRSYIGFTGWPKAWMKRVTDVSRMSSFSASVAAGSTRSAYMAPEFRR